MCLTGASHTQFFCIFHNSNVIMEVLKSEVSLKKPHTGWQRTYQFSHRLLQLNCYRPPFGGWRDPGHAMTNTTRNKGKKMRWRYKCDIFPLTFSDWLSRKWWKCGSSFTGCNRRRVQYVLTWQRIECAERLESTELTCQGFGHGACTKCREFLVRNLVVIPNMDCLLMMKGDP